MSSISTSKPPIASRREVTLWAVGVVVAGFLLPGLGIVLALVLAFSRLRNSPARIRWGLVGLGVAVLAVQIIGLAAWGGTTGHTGPAHIAR